MSPPHPHSFSCCLSGGAHCFFLLSAGANVFLDSGYHVKLADFDLANDSASCSETCGTPGFMAPEVVKGRRCAVHSREVVRACACVRVCVCMWRAGLCGAVWCGVVWCGVWCPVLWRGVAWRGVVRVGWGKVRWGECRPPA